MSDLVERIQLVRQWIEKAEEEILLPLTAEEQERLTDHAVVSRYPGDREPISRAEAEEAVALARKAREAIRAYLPQEATSGQ